MFFVRGLMPGIWVVADLPHEAGPLNRNPLIFEGLGFRGPRVFRFFKIFVKQMIIFSAGSLKFSRDYGKAEMPADQKG
jgi:hypothetical protein